MKKLCLVLLLMLGISPVVCNAQEVLPLIVKPGVPGDDNIPGGNVKPKSPILVPVVYLDGNVLSFDESLEGCTVQLLDENENIVFSHSIEENQTSVTFPGTLSGTYELQIVRGSITFYCYIEL